MAIERPGAILGEYKDTGCHLHPRCLECPEPACIFEERPKNGSPKGSEHKRRVMELRLKGLTSRQIADTLGITQNAVNRLLRGARG